jgi:hypothetical protein
MVVQPAQRMSSVAQDRMQQGKQAMPLVSE